MATLISFSPNTVIKSSEVNSNFNALNTQLGVEHNANGTHSVIDAVAMKQNLVSVTDGGVVDFDMDTSNIFTLTMGGNRTFTFSNADTGQVFIIMITQGGAGSFNPTYPAGITWANGTEPTLTTTAGQTDILGFITTGAGSYYGVVIERNL